MHYEELQGLAENASINREFHQKRESDRRLIELWRKLEASVVGAARLHEQVRLLQHEMAAEAEERPCPESVPGGSGRWLCVYREGHSSEFPHRFEDYEPETGEKALGAEAVA